MSITVSAKGGKSTTTLTSEEISLIGISLNMAACAFMKHASDVPELSSQFEKQARQANDLVMFFTGDEEVTIS